MKYYFVSYAYTIGAIFGLGSTGYKVVDNGGLFNIEQFMCNIRGLHPSYTGITILTWKDLTEEQYEALTNERE